MQKRLLPLAITALLLSLIGWNCTKLDTTDIGGDLLPDVDNVRTFADTLLINTTQGFFNDSTAVGRYDDHAIGKITNDPLFGTTTANVYMQLKPPFYPYYFGNVNDTIVGFDSVVLCLKYTGFWGDSILPVGLEVREVSDNTFRDSVQKLNTTAYRPAGLGTVLGTAVVDARRMADTIYFNNKRDKVTNQIRIKLSNAWASQLFYRDSMKNNPGNNAFYNDSIYRNFYNGIAVLATGASNGLLYVSLSDTATKLEVHYRRKNGGPVDSVYNSLRFNPVITDDVTKIPASNATNYIERNRNGFPVKTNTDPNVHYLQTAPGTFINLNIPGLATLSNRVIHRAEIIVEQIPTVDPLDEIFSTPNFLYVDLKDTGITDKWKPVYFDLNTATVYDPDNASGYIPGQIDYQYFGGYRRSKIDLLSGNLHKYYNFNITRYVQRIVTQHTRVYDMRLYAPFNLNYPQYSGAYIPYGNNIAFGRVKIGSGSNPNFRLRLRIVYSKI
ncbi:MAG: DUF4270 family protein [Ferruginibacter sp.]|nr:DUF4270 family protein [Ferruginibacter sp.]